MFPTAQMFGYTKLLDRGDRLRAIRGRTHERRVRRTSPHNQK